jgi:hypothetical protein
LGRHTIYNSIYGVANAVNKCPNMDFKGSGASFPSHDEQREIAAGFKMKSAADFDRICLAIDGMLVWTNQPSKEDCADLNIGERCFHCYRKDKYGVLLMAGCDYNCRFRWADVKHPGSTSDYTAWITSKLGMKLQHPNQDIVLEDYTIIGDGAFVKSDTMAVPIPGKTLPRIKMHTTFIVHRLGLQSRGLLVFWSIASTSFVVQCRFPSRRYRQLSCA